MKINDFKSVMAVLLVDFYHNHILLVLKLYCFLLHYFNVKHKIDVPKKKSKIYIQKIRLIALTCFLVHRESYPVVLL